MGVEVKLGKGKVSAVEAGWEWEGTWGYWWREVNTGEEICVRALYT